jgi:hypothetical protein
MSTEERGKRILIISAQESKSPISFHHRRKIASNKSKNRKLEKFIRRKVTSERETIAR